MYCFGSEFRYNSESVFNPSNHKQIDKKYDSLMQESTQNEIPILTKAQFDTELKKAKMYFNIHYSKKCRSKLCKGISVQHLLAVMIYCNYDNLQNEFSILCRHNTAENDKINNFYHLGRLLKEAVNQFGTKISTGTIKRFYHGIKEQLLFPTIIGKDQCGVSIYSPLSTSTSFEVAVNFSCNNGLIAQFGGAPDAKAKYFSTRLVSDFSNEYEMLFFQTHYPLQINNITDPRTVTDFGIILNALRAIEQIVDGKLNNTISPNVLEIATVIIENQLCKYEPYKYDYARFKGFHPYARKVIDRYWQNGFHKRQICVDRKIIPSECDLNQVLFHQASGWIKIDVIRKLFPNTVEVSVRNVALKNLTMDNILYQIDMINQSDSTLDINIQSIKNSHHEISAQQALSQYGHQFAKNHWQITQNNLGWLCCSEKE
eukprot:55677_1